MVSHRCLQELPEELVVLGAAGTSSAVPSTTEKVAQGRSWAEKEQHLGIHHRGCVMPPVWVKGKAILLLSQINDCDRVYTIRFFPHKKSGIFLWKTR